MSLSLALGKDAKFCNKPANCLVPYNTSFLLSHENFPSLGNLGLEGKHYLCSSEWQEVLH